MTKLSPAMKKRFFILIFIFLPICNLVGFFVSTKVISLLNFHVDAFGVLLVVLVLIPVNLRAVFSAYRKLKKRSAVDER